MEKEIEREIDLDLLEQISGIKKDEIISYGIFDEFDDLDNKTGRKYIDINYVKTGGTKLSKEILPHEKYITILREFKIKKILE